MTTSSRSRRRRPRLLAAAALVALTLGACDDSTPSERPAKPSSKLLTAAQVGDGAKASPLAKADRSGAVLCGPETRVLLRDADADDFAAFERGGERVVVGAFEPESVSYIERRLEDVRGNIASCASTQADPPRERWKVTELPRFGESVVAFSWVRWGTTAPGETVGPSPSSGPSTTVTSGVRAYQVVDDHLVMVRLSTDSSTPPEPGELRTLLDAQVAKVH